MIYIYSKSTPNNGTLWAKCNDIESLNKLYQYFIGSCDIGKLNDFYISDGVHTFKFLKLAYKHGFRKTLKTEKPDTITGDAKKILF